MNQTPALDLPSMPLPATSSGSPTHRLPVQLPATWRWAWLTLLILAVVLIAAQCMRSGAVASPTYATAELKHGSLAAKVTANGALSALVTVNVGSQVSGRIESLRADFGSRVTKGQVIATLDQAMFKAAAEQATANHAAARAGVARAQAQLLNAERQFQRVEALHTMGVATTADRDSGEAALGVARADVGVAQSNLAQARAAREQAELNLRYTTILSPIDGVVLARNVDVGQTVAAVFQAPILFSIAQDLTHMQVDTSVAEADVGKLHAGMNVSFSVDAYPGRVFPGRLRQIRDNAQTVQNVVTYDAVVDVENSEHLLKPGMTASVNFVHDERQDALLVPNVALRFRPDSERERLNVSTSNTKQRTNERTLWVLRHDAAVAVPVTLGISDGVMTEIVHGDVRTGDAVILEALNQKSKVGS